MLEKFKKKFKDWRMKRLVIQEAKNLKRYATKNELSYLDFDNLKPDNKGGCIYGQMTGNCFSRRAEDLIIRCAPRVYKINSVGQTPALYGLINNRLNGKPSYEKARYTYFSPIEVFIYNNRNKENNKRLIDYLKDKNNNLKFV